MNSSQPIPFFLNHDRKLFTCTPAQELGDAEKNNIQEIEENSIVDENFIDEGDLDLEETITTLDAFLIKKNPNDPLLRIIVCLQTTIDLQSVLTNESIVFIWKRIITPEQLQSIEDKTSWLYLVGDLICNEKFPYKSLISWMQLLASLAVLSSDQNNPYFNINLKKSKNENCYEFIFPGKATQYKIYIPIAWNSEIVENLKQLNNFKDTQNFRNLILNFIISIQKLPETVKELTLYERNKDKFSSSFFENFLEIGLKLQTANDQFLWAISFDILSRYCTFKYHPKLGGKLLQLFPKALASRRHPEDQRTYLKFFENLLKNLELIPLEEQQIFPRMVDLIDKKKLTFESARATWISEMADIHYSEIFYYAAKFLWDDYSKTFSNEAKRIAGLGHINGLLNRAALTQNEQHITYAFSVFLGLMKDKLLDQHDVTRYFSQIVATIYHFKKDSHYVFLKHLETLCSFSMKVHKSDSPFQFLSDAILFEWLVEEILSDNPQELTFLERAISMVKEYVVVNPAMQPRLARIFEEKMPKIDSLAKQLKSLKDE